MDIIRGHCKVMLLISEQDTYASSWLGSATLSHMQRAPMTKFTNLRRGYISDASSSFCTLKRSINWLWERFCVSQADVLLSGRADSTLSEFHITCSIYFNQVSEMVLTNRSLNFDVRTLQPHRADTCIFQHMSHATYQSFCMNDHKWHCCSSFQFIWKKLGFQSNGFGLVLANTIGKFLSIFGTTAHIHYFSQ